MRTEVMHDVALMWSLGPGEIMAILVVAILLFGPKRLPELGQALGEGLSSFKKASKSDPKSLPPTDE
jgi:sec-independent protein translocase protein TatA